MFFSILSVSCRRNPPVDGNFRILKWRYRFHIFGLFLRPNFREYHHKIWPTIWYERTSILGSWRSPIDIYIYIFIYIYIYIYICIHTVSIGIFFGMLPSDGLLKFPLNSPGVTCWPCCTACARSSVTCVVGKPSWIKALNGAEAPGTVPRVKDVVKWWRYHRT